MAALKVATHGESVLLAEAHPRMGGAWRLTTAFGLEQVEIGPHVMRRNRRAYRMIESALGLALLPVRPPPQEVHLQRGRFFRIPYEAPWLKHLISAVIPAAESDRPSRGSIGARRLIPLAKAARDYWKYVRAGTGIQHYPASGCRELLESMNRALQVQGVEVRNGLRVERLDLDVRTGRLRIVAGDDCFEAKRALLNPHVDGIQLAIDGIPIELDYVDDSTWQAHFLVKQSRSRPGSFTFLGESSAVRMVSDISQFTPGLSQLHPECRLYTAWINPEYADVSGPRDAIAQLKAVGVIPHDALLLDHSINRFTRRKLTAPALESIRTSFGQFVEVLQTDDLTADCMKLLEIPTRRTPTRTAKT